MIFPKPDDDNVVEPDSNLISLTTIPRDLTKASKNVIGGQQISSSFLAVPSFPEEKRVPASPVINCIYSLVVPAPG
jgi:hypothetical protein